MDFTCWGTRSNDSVDVHLTVPPPTFTPTANSMWNECQFGSGTERASSSEEVGPTDMMLMRAMIVFTIRADE